MSILHRFYASIWKQIQDLIGGSIIEEGRYYQFGFAAGTHSFKTEKSSSEPGRVVRQSVSDTQTGNRGNYSVSVRWDRTAGDDDRRWGQQKDGIPQDKRSINKSGQTGDPCEIVVFPDDFSVLNEIGWSGCHNLLLSFALLSRKVLPVITRMIMWIMRVIA